MAVSTNQCPVKGPTHILLIEVFALGSLKIEISGPICVFFKHGACSSGVERLAAQCCFSWARRLRALARMRPQHGDRILMVFFLSGGLSCCPMHDRPLGPRPAASLSLRRNAADPQERAAAHTARSAWSTGGRPVPAAGALAGASVAAARLATWATRASRGAPAAPWPLPGSHRDAKCSYPRSNGRGQRSYPPGWGEPAQHCRPSATRTPRRRAGVRPRQGCWARVHPKLWTWAPPGPQSVRHLTGLFGGSRGGCQTTQRVGGPQTPYHPSQQGGAIARDRPPWHSPPARRTWKRRQVREQQGPPCAGQRGGAQHRGRCPPSPPAKAGALVQPAARQDPLQSPLPPQGSRVSPGPIPATPRGHPPRVIGAVL